MSVIFPAEIHFAGSPVKHLSLLYNPMPEKIREVRTEKSVGEGGRRVVRICYYFEICVTLQYVLTK